jgi:hypothetical protein
MNNFALHYLTVLRKEAAPAPAPVLNAMKGLGSLVSKGTGVTGQTVAGAVAAPLAAHYGGGLSWENSLPWTVAGGLMSNKHYRNFLVGRGEQFANTGARINSSANRILSGMAVKGGIPAAIAIGSDVPAITGNIRGVTGQASENQMGKNWADAGKGIELAGAMMSGAGVEAMKTLNKINDPKTVGSDPLGIGRLVKPVEQIASTGQRFADMAEAAGQRVTGAAGQAGSFIKDNAKPIGYGAAALGGGFVLSKLLDSISKFRQSDPKKEKQPA